MPGARQVDAVAKALRRKAQLHRWSRLQQQQQQSSTAGTQTSESTTRLTSKAPTHLQAFASASNTPAAQAMNASSTLSSSPSDHPKQLSVEVSRSLQQAYRQRDTAQPSHLQRRLTGLLDSSTSKAEAVEAFFLVARSDKEAVTPVTFRHFTSALLRHNVAAQMGMAAYEAALADAVGSSDSRWGTVDPAESRAFALYQARRLERYAVKGTSFEEKLGLTLEGADNSVVALTHFQIEKHAATTLPVPLDVLEELMHLDVSWTSALKVYTHAKKVATVDPPASMTTRLLSLMTGYRTNGLGSRPWAQALQLYEQLNRSGYDVPLDAHAAALDAVWRRGDTFVKPHRVPSAQEQDAMWSALVSIRDRVDDASVVGEEGCRFSEALVKAASAAGRWEAAVQVLTSMDITRGDASSRFLVPTAETFLFTMAACNVAHNAAYATSLLQTFGALYTLRSAHPEALNVYLQSLRHVEHFVSHIGMQVEGLVQDGQGLDRPCTVTCLQLLSSQRVQTATEKWRLAQQLVQLYDSNPWPQQPQVRRAELQTVFRCCHLIAAASAAACPLVSDLKKYLTSVFGADSPECRWLHDTEIYSLSTVSSWEQALRVFDRQVTHRPPDAVADLPIPLRQARGMLAQTLVRCGLAAHQAEDMFLLDEDRQEDDRAAVRDYCAVAVEKIKEVYASTADTLPHSAIGELLLLQALHTDSAGERQRLALAAMRELACGEAAAVNPRVVDYVSQALGLTEEHVEGVLVEGSAQLRAKALQEKEKHLSDQCACLERVFL